MSAVWFGRYLETSVYRVEIKNTAGILNNAPNVPTHGRRAGRAGVSRDHRERRGRPVTPPIYHRSARAPRAPSAADLRGGRNPRLLAEAAGAMPGRGALPGERAARRPQRNLVPFGTTTTQDDCTTNPFAASPIRLPRRGHAPRGTLHRDSSSLT